MSAVGWYSGGCSGNLRIGAAHRLHVARPVNWPIRTPMLTEFKKFLVKQNIIALAVAVVVGTALNGLIKALVDDFIMPIVAFASPGGDWQKATWDLGPVKFGVGNFLAALLNFLIIGFVAWRITKIFVPSTPAPVTKVCTYCRMTIDDGATRCPHCTSQLAGV